MSPAARPPRAHGASSDTPRRRVLDHLADPRQSAAGDSASRAAHCDPDGPRRDRTATPHRAVLRRILSRLSHFRSRRDSVESESVNPGGSNGESVTFHGCRWARADVEETEPPSTGTVKPGDKTKIVIDRWWSVGAFPIIGP